MSRFQGQMDSQLINGEHWVRGRDVTEMLRKVAAANATAQQHEAALMLLRVADSLDVGLVELATDQAERQR